MRRSHNRRNIAMDENPRIPANPIHNSLTNFACSMLHHMSQDENNSAICPISLFNSLAMVYAGTSGKNAKEIEKVLNIESDSTVLLENIKQLLNRIKTFENTYHKFIRIPSRIFYNRNDNLKNNYIKLITKCFGQNCKPEGITCKDTSAMQINEWIRRETNNRILQIVLAYQLNQSLKLILCSAFYFRTDWKYPFKKERTRRNYFYINPNNRIYIPFMAKLRQFRYRDDTDLACEIVELPFGHGLCMYILLPHQINGLNSLCQRIDFTTIEMITSSLQFRDMQVFLPRFRIHYQYDPLKTLQSIGMIKAFRERHDNVAFGRMTNNLKYSISMINHEIIIDVNEGPQLPKKLPKNLPNQPYWYYDILTNEIYTMESSIDYNNPGIEVATQSNIPMTMYPFSNYSSPIKWIEPKMKMRINHPFVCIIYDKQSKAFIFAGKIYNPSN